MNKRRYKIAIDFDGVLNLYAGWKGPDELYEIRPDADKFLETLTHQGFDLILFTARDTMMVSEWLQKKGLASYFVDVTNVKPAAVMFIDDRGIQFRGDFQQTLEDIATFRPHWQ